MLVTINSSQILIPKNSLFEVNQAGLFNDFIINVVPLDYVRSTEQYSHDIIFDQSVHSCFIKHNSYVKGYKGVNYDDLIRATTRITQRFDDPRFFSLFYLLLNNTFSLTDELLNLFYHSSHLFNILLQFILF